MAGTTSRGVVRTGARGVAVGTAAIAILGVLQQAIGAFDPRPSMSARRSWPRSPSRASCTKRLGDRRREDREAAELRRQLVVWPPRPLSEVDPVHLGAFPRAATLGAEPPLRAAHAGCRTGAARSSRAASCSCTGRRSRARRARRTRLPRRRCRRAGHRPAQRRRARRAARARCHVRRRRGTRGVAGRPRPLRGDARSGDASTRSSRSVRPRRAGALRPRRRRSSRRLRTEDWDALRAASGPAGLRRTRRGRSGAVVRAAGAGCSPARARRPRASATRASTSPTGSGPALASTGTDATVPRPVPAPVLRDAAAAPAARRATRGCPPALTVAAVTVAGLIWALAGFSTPTAPPIADQIAAINRAAAREGRRTERPAGSGALDLHATVRRVVLFLFTDRPGSGRAPRADELRVYDVRRRLPAAEPALRTARRRARAFSSGRPPTSTSTGRSRSSAATRRARRRRALVPFASTSTTTATS